MSDSALIYENILTYMHGGVMSLDLHGRVTTFNPGAERILGLAADAVIGLPFAALFFDDGRNDAFSQAVLDAVYQSDASHTADTTYWRGEERLYLNVTSSVLWQTGAASGRRAKVGIIVLFTDVTRRKTAEDGLRAANEQLERRVAERTRQLSEANADLTQEIAERKKAQDRLAFLAEHDALTGLPNRALFEDRLQQAIGRHHRDPSRGVALLYLDLDGFKKVNDTLGHGFGDWILKQVAVRLGTCVRETDTIARLGGDEFTIIVEDYGAMDEVLGIVDRILRVIAEPYHNPAGGTGHLGISIGVAAFPHAGRDETALVRAADEAMYEAKHSGKGVCRIAPSAPAAAPPAD